MFVFTCYLPITSFQIHIILQKIHWSKTATIVVLATFKIILPLGTNNLFTSSMNLFSRNLKWWIIFYKIYGSKFALSSFLSQLGIWNPPVWRISDLILMLRLFFRFHRQTLISNQNVKSGSQILWANTYLIRFKDEDLKLLFQELARVPSIVVKIEQIIVTNLTYLTNQN